MELNITTNLETALPQHIDFNFEQLKEWLSGRLEHYNSLVVTEDNIKGGKEDKSSLNALKKALEDRRISLKKEYLKPYDEFEKKIKELVGMIDEPVRAIDRQIKVFEDAKKAEKQTLISDFYASVIGELEQLLPFEKLYNPRWMNATYKMTDIQKEITETISKVKNDLGIIKAMHLECEQQMLDTYLRTLDMSAAMAEKTRFEEQQKRIKEYEAEQKRKAGNIVTLDDSSTPDKAAIHNYIEHRISGTTPADSAQPEQLKTIKVVFHDTTEAFRHEMRSLTEKYGVKYGGLN
jgi:hypothetical protein